MSPRLRAALYAQAGAVFSLHPCLYAGDRPTASRSRFATLLPGDAAVSPSNGDHAGTQRADPPSPGRARSIEVLVDPGALPALRASHDQPVNSSVQRY